MSGSAVATPPVLGQGLNLSGDVRLGSLTLNYHDPVTGCTWILTDLAGWWTLPDVAMPDDPRPIFQDGSYDQDGQFKFRSIGLTGWVFAPNSAALATARSLLMDVCNLVRSTTILQADEGPTKQAVVRLDGTPVLSDATYDNRMSFQIPLKSNDPLKYGAGVLNGSTFLTTDGTGRTYDLTYDRVYGTAGVQGIVVLNNIGKAPSAGTITFAGPLAAGMMVESIENQARLGINKDLGIGDVVTLDLGNQTVTFNGTANYRIYLSSNSKWFRILPGVNTFRFTGTQSITADPPTVPQALMTVSSRNAWFS